MRYEFMRFCFQYSNEDPGVEEASTAELNALGQDGWSIKGVVDEPDPSDYGAFWPRTDSVYLERAMEA